MRSPLRRTGLALALLTAMALTACAAPSPEPPPPTDPSPPPTTAATAVRIGLPFQPNVQFAPLYLAQDAGHYREAGLDVTFEYGDEAELVRLVAAGERHGLIAGGDQVILARANDLPVKYVMTWYERFPVAVLATEQPLSKPQDLVGMKVGLPAPGGTSMLGWQVLLLANGIAPERVSTEVIGFTQAEALRLGRVDAAVGYATNEPLQLRAEGLPVSVLEVADTFNLVSNGLVVGDALARERPELVQGLVSGTLRGIAAALADPDAAYAAAAKRVPELAEPPVQATQRQVLAASQRFWTAPPTLGAIDGERWTSSQDYMRQLGLIQSAAALADLVDPRFVAASAGATEP